jgi:hypothetical protein
VRQQNCLGSNYYFRWWQVLVTLSAMKRMVLVAAFSAALGLVGVPAAAASTCNDGAVNRGNAGDYSICQGGAWQHYPAPTYNPNSGDGYGPNQPLPPACIRFNQPCPQ